MVSNEFYIIEGRTVRAINPVYRKTLTPDKEIEMFPQTVRLLSDRVFYECQSVYEMLLPERITTIGEACFSSCHNLTRVVMGPNVTKIGTGCFAYCNNLKEIFFL